MYVWLLALILALCSIAFCIRAFYLLVVVYDDPSKTPVQKDHVVDKAAVCLVPAMLLPVVSAGVILSKLLGS